MNIHCCIFFSSLTLLSASTSAQVPNSESSAGDLIFQSGFENYSKVINRNRDADIVGAEKSLSKNSDWVNDLDNHPNIGNFNLQY